MREMISNAQWARYEAKYGGLMHTIARKISGDAMTASYEDNRSDLQVAAVESVIAYKKKTGQEFDQAFGTELFDKYTKTVLWNRKAKKGIPLSKKMKFRKKHKTIYDKEGKLFVIADPSSLSEYSSNAVESMFDTSDADVVKIVDTIVSNPAVITEDGKLKCHSISKSTGISIHYVFKAVGKIRRILESNYGKIRN